MFCSEIYDYPILKSPFALLLIGCAFVMLTYLTAAIILDAYVPLNFPGIPYLYLFFGAVSIIAFSIHQRVPGFLSDFTGWICLALGIVFLWAGSLMLIMKPIRKFLDSKLED